MGKETHDKACAATLELGSTGNDECAQECHRPLMYPLQCDLSERVTIGEGAKRMTSSILQFAFFFSLPVDRSGR